MIGGLLVVNATLSFLQEGRAQKALALLRQQLRVQARVRRDGAWLTLAAEELVPGDIDGTGRRGHRRSRGHRGEPPFRQNRRTGPHRPVGQPAGT